MTPESYPRRVRFSVRRFLRMTDAGAFAPEARVELLAGIPVRIGRATVAQSSTVDILGDPIRRLPLGEAWALREEKPITLGRSWRPIPNLTLLRGPRARYLEQPPTASDVGLIVEVADAAIDLARGPKWRRYAACAIPAYWVVDLGARRVDVYTDPVGEGRAANYRRVESFDEAGRVPVVVEGHTLGEIAVETVLPPLPVRSNECE